MMKKIFNKFWANYPFSISIFFYLLYSSYFLILILKQNNNNFVYPLDDTYIHMAIAKNFAFNGTWGITLHHFSSTSSSPIWTFILSIFFILFGNNIYIPLILNKIVGILTIYFFYHYNKIFNFSKIESLTALLIVIFIVPLILISFLGLEHTLHFTFSFLLLIFFIISEIKNIKSNGRIKPFIGFLLMIPFAVLTRYETLFIIFAILIILFLQKKFKEVLWTIVITGLSLSIYGIFSIKNGWYFFPNSILLKGNVSFPPLIHVYLGEINKIFILLTSHWNVFLLAIPLLLILVILISNYIITKEIIYYFILLIIPATCQILFAQTGWHFRYEAYLLFNGTFLMFLIIKNLSLKEALINNKFYLRLNNILVSILMLAILTPFFKREYFALWMLPHASKNIYQQQIQMAKFVRENLNEETIALNDIGAVCYFSNIKCVDLVGLGTLEVLQAKKSEKFNTSFIEKFANKENVTMAIIYDYWFTGNISPPSSWIKIGEWQIFNNVVCGSDVVSFYVVDKSRLNELKSKFAAFSNNLVKGVLVKYY